MTKAKQEKIFKNQVIDKKQLKQIMAKAFADFGMVKASYLANQIKDLGFSYASKAGLSLSIEDLRVPPTKKNLIYFANKKVNYAEFEVQAGYITEVERFQKVIQTWTTTSESLKDEVVHYFRQKDPLNSVYMMAFSGARGNLSQVRQLVGMRGLMSDPNGQIIDLPIITNFREGLTITDYIISSYGARKGLVDTALRTADSGYLTRRLIDVAQDIVTREKDCKTKDGISLSEVVDANTTFISLSNRSLGRILAQDVKNPKNGEIIAFRNQEVSLIVAKLIATLKISKVVVRSPLTCACNRAICQQCYGWNLAYGKLIDLGEAVGIIAAQSIGEPGTQLTMRTFHTGGVFTTEPSRQIRATCSGKIVFSSSLKTKVTRTLYGEVAYLSENEASLSLINYENSALSLSIYPETLIFVKNKAIVKKNDILYELSSSTIQSGAEKAFKYVYAKHSGQIYLENSKNLKVYSFKNIELEHKKQSLLWILEGEVFNVPFASKLKVQVKKDVKKHQSLAEALIVSTNKGFIQESKKKTKQNYGLLLCDNFPQSRLYLEKQENQALSCLLYGQRNRKLVFSFLDPFLSFIKEDSYFGSLINTKYQTKTGGHFYSNSFMTEEKQGSKKKKAHGTLFYLPESSYEIKNEDFNNEVLLLDLKNGDFLEKNTEVFLNQFTPFSGLVEISEDKKGNKDLLLKPGRFIPIPKNKDWKIYHQSILYPGEILVNKVGIKNLSYAEIKTFKKKTFLCLFPIVRYEISSDENEMTNFDFYSLNSKKRKKRKSLSFDFSFQPTIKGNKSIQLVQHHIAGQDLVVEENLSLRNTLLLSSQKISLVIAKQKPFIFHSFLPNELKRDEVVLSSFVKAKQFIEPYTKVASFQVLLQKEGRLTTSKVQYLGKQKKILLNSNTNYKKVFFEQKTNLFYDQKLVKPGEKTKTNFISTYAGLITKSDGDCLTYHLGQPYLFSQGAILEKRPGDLIKAGEALGQLIYERARTGDIVQGLPRVERILEARKPKVEASLVYDPGIVTLLQSTAQEFHLWLTPNGKEVEKEDEKKSKKSEKKLKKTEKGDFYTLPSSQRLLVGKFDFVNVGQALNDASINPHTLLNIYFLHYQNLKLNSQYLSAYRSFRKIQAILLNSIQGVYYSQGVNIADKHVEIIIKQMTSKVEINFSNGSPLKTNELVSLNHAHYVNNCLQESQHAFYSPVLLGITKASLKTNSFISAASFQHTTRILTEAAILGKVDWLRGLKENVIIGRLIPAGTGFNAYNDISYMKVKVNFLTKEKKELTLSDQHQKMKTLKNRIKFKFAEFS